MLSEKQLIDFHSLRPGVIHTIEKIEFLEDSTMDIELENVKINLPTSAKKIYMYFLKYNGESIEFVLPTRMYCFCPGTCDFCCCDILLHEYNFCACVEFDQVLVHDVNKFEAKINELLDNKYIWCWECAKYVWFWEYCPH